MAYFAGKKRQSQIFITYLLLAVICSFSLSITFHFNETIPEGPNGDYSVNRAIDWLASEAVSVTKAPKPSSSPLGNGVLRIFTSGWNNATVYLSESYFKPALGNYVPNIRNTILLELRI